MRKTDRIHITGSHRVDKPFNLCGWSDRSGKQGLKSDFLQKSAIAVRRAGNVCLQLSLGSS